MRGTDQRTCPHCGDGQWMYVEGNHSQYGPDEFTIRCPACSIIVEIPAVCVDFVGRIVHVVRPELVMRHRLQGRCRCGACVQAGLPLLLGRYAVVVHFDNGVPQ